MRFKSIELRSLYFKEIIGFLSGVVGYAVIVLFLVTLSLLLWTFPGDFNILDSGYAQLDALFILAPWMFMFLANAITMKSFSEEIREGTIEFLLTKPLTDWQIIISKFLASWTLLIIALLPTLFYFYTIFQLANPVGNVDGGAVIGSYIGLLFLSAGFIAIGLFASSISSSQITAFIVGVFLSFVVYIGFDAIGALAFMGSLGLFFEKLGINEHYISLSRGVIDTRDILYFFGLVLFFMTITKLKLDSRKW